MANTRKWVLIGGKAGFPVERWGKRAQNWRRSGDQIGAQVKGRG